MNQAVLTTPSMSYHGHQRQSLGARIWAALEVVGAGRAVGELRRQGLLHSPMMPALADQMDALVARVSTQ